MLHPLCAKGERRHRQPLPDRFLRTLSQQRSLFLVTLPLFELHNFQTADMRALCSFLDERCRTRLLMSPRPASLAMELLSLSSFRSSGRHAARSQRRTLKSCLPSPVPLVAAEVLHAVGQFVDRRCKVRFAERLP